MKATGIVRKIDDLGRLVIPKEIRDVQGIGVGTPMEFFTNNEGQIVVRKYTPQGACVECGDSGKELVGKSGICKPCAIKLSQSLLEV